MRLSIAIAVLLVATTGFADDSPLVKAAKANGGPKKKTTKKVITNADLDKSSGKKTIATPAAKPAAPPAAPPAGSIAEQDKVGRRPSASTRAWLPGHLSSSKSSLASR